MHPGVGAGEAVCPAHREERTPHYHLGGPRPASRAPGASAPSDWSQTLERHRRRREAVQVPAPGEQGRAGGLPEAWTRRQRQIYPRAPSAKHLRTQLPTSRDLKLETGQRQRRHPFHPDSALPGLQS